MVAEEGAPMQNGLMRQLRKVIVPLGIVLLVIVMILFLLPLLHLSETYTLIIAMTAIGIISVSGAYASYRLKLIRRLPSLRWALLATMVMVVTLIFLNVWVSAQLMFISEYDLQVTGVLLLFAGVIAVMFGFFISRAITEGIQELADAAALIAQGELGTRLSVEGSDELADFARTFNWMAQSLQELDAQKRHLDQERRDLIAWASHDLRTPVTSIRAMIEALADGVVEDPATMARYTQLMQIEIGNLTSLIDNLFQLAQLDAGHIHLDYQYASLRDMISDTLSGMRARASQQQITLTGEIIGNLDMIEMAPDKIQRVLNNLLDNAFRYTPAGGWVIIRAWEEPQTWGDSVSVSVHNDAPNMETFDVANAFTPFYRRETARVQSQDGHRGAGLGLAITQGFVEAHGGVIIAKSAPGHGVTMTFSIPVRAQRHKSDLKNKG